MATLWRAVCPPALLFLACAPTLAQNDPNPWETKRWMQWTKKDCAQILEDSPWARTQQAKVPGTHQWVRVQLYSALPVRQALMRRKLIAGDYDRANDAKKSRLEREAAAEFPPSALDEIAVRVEFGVSADGIPDPAGGYRDAEGNWISETRYFPIQHPNTGEYGLLLVARRDPVRSLRKIVLKKASFVLIFPRVIGGQPVLMPDDPTFHLALAGPPPRGESNVSMKLKLKKPKPGEPGYDRAVQVRDAAAASLATWNRERRFWKFQLHTERMTYLGNFEF